MVDIRALLDDPARLELVAQPIVDVRRGVVTGYEALSRFDLTPRVPPDHVFAEATRQGLGAELEALVVRRALELAAERPNNCFLSINVDPTHLLTPVLDAALADTESLAGIVLELTEHREIDDVPALQRKLDALRRRGAFVAVDDAGSGYSGLKQLLELRPQIVKLDRALVSDLHEDEAKRALVQMLGDLVGRLDAWLLAEGVETESELAVLQKLGVPLAQGYVLGKPAKPWSDILPAARDLLALPPPSVRRSRIVRHVLESGAICGVNDAWPNANISVRVTDEGRPVALRFTVAGEAHTREEHELMRVKPESALDAVARRAATRPERVRWDPIVCIDERGHFRGVIRLARLICALAGDDNVPPVGVSIN